MSAAMARLFGQNSSFSADLDMSVSPSGGGAMTIPGKVAFDTGKTFRDDIYPAYKGTRAKMPDDLRPQIERIREMVDVFNIPRLEKEGFEADDVLGSVARIAAEKGLGAATNEAVLMIDPRFCSSM